MAMTFQSLKALYQSKNTILGPLTDTQFMSYIRHDICSYDIVNGLDTDQSDYLDNLCRLYDRRGIEPDGFVAD